MNSKSAIISVKDLISYHEESKLLESNEEFHKIPFYHSTNHKDFVNHVIAKNSLNANPAKCPVFDEKLLYFFYGKAEYWPKKSQEAVYKAWPPITIAYSVESLKDYSLRRVYPFDTGAYAAKRYLDDMEIGDLDKYELSPTIKGIANFIELFYGTIENYILMEKKLKFELHDFTFCLCAGYLDTMHNKIDMMIENADYGEQAFAIETQYSDPKITHEPEVIFVPEYMFRSKKANEEIREVFPSTRIIKYPCRKKQNITRKFNSMRDSVIEYSLSKI